MIDLFFDGDFKLDGSDLARTSDIDQAIKISLFTDARINGAGGWFGDALTLDNTGSKLHSLDSRLTDDTVNRFKDYARESLQWLISDGVVESITVDAEKVCNNLNFMIRLKQSCGTSNYSYVFQNVG